MTKETVEAWITTYALSSGIKHVTGTVNHDISSGMLSYGPYLAAHGKDWHRIPAAAIARAVRLWASGGYLKFIWAVSSAYGFGWWMQQRPATHGNVAGRESLAENAILTSDWPGNP